MAKKTKRQRGLCSFWGCKEKAIIAMISREEPGWMINQLCKHHWTCPGPIDTPSYAQMYTDGTAQYDIEVIASKSD